jgi:hypothetical protein
MAPATVAGAPPRPRGAWDRESIIQAIHEWVALHGEPPRAADWNPSSAKWSGQLWRVERYRAGRPDGSPWPALNAAKRPFGGSLTAAIVAAGLEPARPGPTRRADVDPEQAGRAVMSPEGRAMVDAALGRARDADRRIASLESQLGRARERVLRLTEERDAARRSAPAKPRVIRERVRDDAASDRARKQAAAAEARAEAAAASARERLEVARADAGEARTMAKRLAARLERSEATVASLREERRELRRDVEGLADRASALERLLDDARAEAARAPAVVRVREEAPGAAAVRAAHAEAERARRAAEAAELRAARAERELRETVAAVRGEARRLTPAELAALRDAGPSGPAVMAAALKDLAAARAGGSPTALAAALGRVARAAVTWQERM